MLIGGPKAKFDRRGRRVLLSKKGEGSSQKNCDSPEVAVKVATSHRGGGKSRKKGTRAKKKNGSHFDFVSKMSANQARTKRATVKVRSHCLGVRRERANPWSLVRRGRPRAARRSEPGREEKEKKTLRCKVHPRCLRALLPHLARL